MKHKKNTYKNITLDYNNIKNKIKNTIQINIYDMAYSQQDIQLLKQTNN